MFKITIKYSIIYLLLYLSILGAQTDFYSLISSQNENRGQGLPKSRMMDKIVETLLPGPWPSGSFDFFRFLRDSYPLPKGLTAPLAEYDYVIIGAGSAGSALASRLTEGKAAPTVLVIEAGRPETILHDIPVIAPYFQRTEYAWPYYAEEQPGSCRGTAKPLIVYKMNTFTGMERRRCYMPRGRAVGGTSVINYMLYTRGRPEDWDNIAADGNYGWSYQDVLPYFKKLERSSLRRNSDSPNKGQNGKVTIENPPFRTRLVEAFLQAGRLLGNPTVDYNEPGEIGLGYVQITTARGHRVSAAKAYLHPHRNRRNLHILPETRATRILFDADSKDATGVEIIRNGQVYKVGAKREVILSAGPMASPQLLMLSGIGPQSDLNALGIPVISNLNVGRTLYDHISFPAMVFTVNTTGISIIEDREATLANIIQWTQFGDGILASPGGVEGLGYIKTTEAEPDQIADVELLSIGGSIISDGGGAIRKGMMITDETFNNAYRTVINAESWTAFPMLLYPRSRGYLQLRDKNPFSTPRIVTNYLTDPKDVATFVAAIRHVMRMINTAPFQKYGAKLHRANYPTCKGLEFNSDEYWECAVRTITSTEHHQVGTCKMGPPHDADAIVDPELRVYGVNKLRVVDTSIIPRSTAAHTNGPAMMIGEKAADLIKRTWSTRSINLGQTNFLTEQFY